MFQTLQQFLLQRKSLQKAADIALVIKGRTLPLQKNHNVQIMRLLNPAWLALSRRTLGYIRQ